MGSPSPAVRAALPLSLPGRDGLVYERRRPEETALHRAVRRGWPQVQAAVSERTGAKLPKSVGKAVRDYLSCGQLPEGFSRFRCDKCKTDLLVAFSCKVRGLCASCDGKRMLEEAEHLTGAVLPEVPYRQWVLTLPYDLRYLAAWNTELRNALLSAMLRALTRHYEQQAKSQGLTGRVFPAAISVAQRFSSDLRLNLHWHILAADGVWTREDNDRALFHPAPPLDTLTVQGVLYDTVLRIDRQLVARGWKEAEDDSFAEQNPALAGLMRAALRGRPVDLEGALPERERKALLRAVPRPHGNNCADMNGYSLHANTRVGELARDELYRLVKYLCRPAVAAGRVTECDDGTYRVSLKTPYRDGTEAIKLSAADLTGRLIAVMPLKRRPTLICHGCFAPNSKLRPLVVKAGASPPGKRRCSPTDCDGHGGEDLTPEQLAARVLAQAEQQTRRLRWSTALELAWKIDVLACPCGGRRRLIATIERPAVICKILAHLGLPTETVARAGTEVWQVRGPPDELFPGDLDATGVELWPAVDEDPGVGVADLPADDWAA